MELAVAEGEDVAVAEAVSVLHSVAPEEEVVPTAQARHVDKLAAPRAALNVPAGQAVQNDALVSL